MNFNELYYYCIEESLKSKLIGVGLAIATTSPSFASKIPPYLDNKGMYDDVVKKTEMYEQLKVHEGYKKKVYYDSENIPTIGVGFNLESSHNRRYLKKIGIDVNELLNGRELTDDEVYKLFEYSYLIAFKDALRYAPNLLDYPEPIVRAIIDMSFNLGYTKLIDFEDMQEAIKNYDIKGIKREMIDSEWYYEVGNRSRALVSLVDSQIK